MKFLVAAIVFSVWAQPQLAACQVLTRNAPSGTATTRAPVPVVITPSASSNGVVVVPPDQPVVIVTPSAPNPEGAVFTPDQPGVVVTPSAPNAEGTVFVPDQPSVIVTPPPPSSPVTVVIPGESGSSGSTTTPPGFVLPWPGHPGVFFQPVDQTKLDFFIYPDTVPNPISAPSIYGAEWSHPAFALPQNARNGRVFGSGAYNLGGNAFDNVLAGNTGANLIDGGAGGDFISGGAGPDLIGGGAGADTLGGEAGDDIIVGGVGPDILVGGAGADTFSFSAGDSMPSAPDHVMDFGPGDRLRLALSNGSSVAFSFIGSAPFSAPGQVRYAQGLLTVDLSGDLVSDFTVMLQLVGGKVLSAEDFLFE